MSSTRVYQHVRAPRHAVYRALLDPRAVQRWMVPDGMRSEVHAFDPREGGGFRISLTYEAPDAKGKSGAHTDTFHGRFVTLVPDAEVVQAIAFETPDPALAGEMRVSYSLREVDGGTEVIGLHEGLPRGVAPADNERGWRSSLAKLAKLVESERSGR